MASISLQPIHRSLGWLLYRQLFLTKTKPAVEPPSLARMTAVVTGSNSGIGLAATRLLLSLKISHFILAVRSLDSGERVARLLREAHPDAKIEVWPLDLNSYESIGSFATRCTALPRLNIAILNAGLQNIGFKANPSTGHEETFQVNYLSTALLALLLLPALKSRKSNDGAPSHLMLVSSAAAAVTSFPEQDAVPIFPAFDKQEGFGASAANERYVVTKLLLLMFMFKLSKLVQPEDVVVNAVDPGFTKGTGLFRNLPKMLQRIAWLPKELMAFSPEKSAWSYVNATAVVGAEGHGSFFSGCEIVPFHPIMYTPEGTEIMDRLWNETRQSLDSPELRSALGLLNIDHAA
ncbi:NAD(P)-binding protein [Thozetella sp. PMI_491]|nr:NAD(P)-binding protein [Thozetella sp. PMI_491]